PEAGRVLHLPAGRVELGVQVRHHRHGVDLAGVAHDEGDAAPGEHDHRHDGGDDHDLHGLVAGLVDADQVLAEEVDGDQAGDQHRPPQLPQVARPGGDVGAEPARDLQAQPDDVLPRRDAADGPRQDVVEDEGGDGQLGGEAPHRLPDDAVDSAADEQGAALDVHP